MEILDPDGFEKEIESQVSYHFNIDIDLAEFSEYSDNHGAGDSPNVSNIDKILDKLGSKTDSPRVN